MNPLPQVDKLSFSLEGAGSENCTGIEIGWQQEAIKENSPVIKPQTNGAILWTARMYLILSGPFSTEPKCAQLAIHSVLGALVNMHA